MQTILFVTELYYQAKGREYYAEDLFLTSVLREQFSLVLCHPKDMKHFENTVDLIMFRNTGPVTYFQKEYWTFRERIALQNIKSYNSFNGKADMNGKNYLVDLTKLGFPVIPTIDNINELHELHEPNRFVLKPKDGADSINLQFVSAAELLNMLHSSRREFLIQPQVDFKYEVSFYFVDEKFHYAFFAPDKTKRWKLEAYTPTDHDLEFACAFVQWNALKWGVQRVDACRTKDGRLLLVELEDLNPYLSLLDLESDIRQRFIQSLVISMQKALASLA